MIEDKIKEYLLKMMPGFTVLQDRTQQSLAVYPQVSAE
jgi:hypothetical protein